MMECYVFKPGRCHISLSDILTLQNQPMCEEQAWALCHQLCSLLEPSLIADLGESFGPWKTFRLPGPEGVLFSDDGSISLRIDSTKPDELFVMETEDQTVDYIGRLMYSCLDWGLGADVERELGETLELLVSQMTKVDIRLGAEHCLQPICTISEVLQVCEERLYNPGQAARHYRSVCATLYSHTIELCHYLQIIQQTKESLQHLIEPESSLHPNITANWNSAQEFVWKDLMEELSRGVVLRSPKVRLDTSAPLFVDTSPFSQLLQDIQLRRYTLRKVGRKGQSRPDPHQALLDVIRSRPKLRPVSERNLKPRFQNAKQEASLHELLMQEIRSTDRRKLLSPWKRKSSLNVETGCWPLNYLMPVYDDDSVTDWTFNSVPSPDQQGTSSEGWLFKGSSPEQKSSFKGCGLSRGRPRARSFTSIQDLYRLEVKDEASVPMTISDMIKRHHPSEGNQKAQSCDTYRNWRVCSCCSKRSLYFTWHNVCSVCSRVVCLECCTEMRLPFKWCINLPLSFFKKILLNKGCEQSRTNFWNERCSWDPSWVPLVLESRLPSSSSVSLHSLAMRDWHSQDICVGCQGLLLEACDAVQSRCRITDPQEI